MSTLGDFELPASTIDYYGIIADNVCDTRDDVYDVSPCLGTDAFFLAACFFFFEAPIGIGIVGSCCTAWRMLIRSAGT